MADAAKRSRRSRTLPRVLAAAALTVACSYDFHGFGTELYEPQACGNGKLEGAEQCDPGPGGPDPAHCTPDCTLAVCGDGKIEADEQCDLGPGNADDGPCTSACKTAVCGDGLVSTEEECDDGNTADNDACTSACKVAICGDSIEQEGVEKCDAGPLNASDGACTPLCQKAVCGDGFTRYNSSPEECDDGNFDDHDGCTNNCKKAYCGDGIVWTGVEMCDGGQDCTMDCAFASCGNGKVDPGEECDDGDDDNTNGCRNTCILPKCGDGIVDLGEECDGNAEPWLACEGCKQYLESTWFLNSTKKIPEQAADVNKPTLGECASFTIPFSDWTQPDAATNAMYGYVHHIEFKVAIEHPDAGELIFHVITFANPTHVPVMRRPGMSEGPVCSTQPGGSVARLTPDHILHFSMTGPCDPQDPNDPDCKFQDPEQLGVGLGTDDVACGEPECAYFSNPGDLQPAYTLDVLRGFNLAPGNPWGKPHWFLCVQDTVNNSSGGLLKWAMVRTLRRKTAD